jgi:hypothetical protein
MRRPLASADMSWERLAQADLDIDIERCPILKARTLKILAASVDALTVARNPSHLGLPTPRATVHARVVHWYTPFSSQNLHGDFMSQTLLTARVRFARTIID